MRSKKIKNWAQLAEIVSGLAVVISLVFLILEIRGNSDLIRANTFNRSIESLIDFRMQIVSNEKSLNTMTDYWDIESPEVLRRQLLVINMWSIYEKTYYSQQYGLVGPAEWERFETRICSYVQPESGMSFWKTSIAVYLTTEFRDFVISSCDQAG